VAVAVVGSRAGRGVVEKWRMALFALFCFLFVFLGFPRFSSVFLGFPWFSSGFLLVFFWFETLRKH
jgi:hypothetical protein